MKNIMKSQLFQLKREKLPYMIFLLVIALLAIMIFNSMDEYENFGEAIAELGYMLPQMSLLFLFVTVGCICGIDFIDQTSNYELMSGHTRVEMYMARVVLSVIIGPVGCLLICFACIGLGSGIFGFGDAVSLSGVLFRYLLMIFPLIRIACEVVFLSFVIRNAYLIYGIGIMYVLFLSELILGFSKVADGFFLGMTNLIRLGNFKSFSTYSPVTLEKYVIYDTSISRGDVLGTVGMSLIVGILFLVLGYRFFATDDIQ